VSDLAIALLLAALGFWLLLTAVWGEPSESAKQAKAEDRQTGDYFKDDDDMLPLR
jgi:hypothetical protein